MKDYHSGGNNILFADWHVELWKDSRSLLKDPYRSGGSKDMWQLDVPVP